MRQRSATMLQFYQQLLRARTVEYAQQALGLRSMPQQHADRSDTQVVDRGRVLASNQPLPPVAVSFTISKSSQYIRVLFRQIFRLEGSYGTLLYRRCGDRRVRLINPVRLALHCGIQSDDDGGNPAACKRVLP